MAKKQNLSMTQRLGGNRTIVLGIVITMLILFTVDQYVASVISPGQGRAEEYVRYTVGGKKVTIPYDKLQSAFGDWQKFQMGQSVLTRRPRSGGLEEFLQDEMTASLARASGLSIPDDSVRDFIRTHPLFQDRSGDFDAKAFAESRQRFFNDLSERAFEVQARRHLLVDHYTKIYANSFLAVSDAECWQRWKGAHTKVEVAYAWQPVAPIREGMDGSAVETGELETYWKDPAVQDRQKTPPRRTFQAAAVRIEDCRDEAWRQAREEWKDDPDLRFEEGEAFLFWSKWRQYDFNLENLDEERLKGLRADNEARVRAEDEEARRAAEERKKKEEEEKAASGEEDDETPDAPPGLPEDEEGQPPADPYETPPGELAAPTAFRLYWRHRAEKELWLQRLLEKVRREMADGDATAEAAFAKWDRPGLGLRVFVETEPLDQYQVERVEGLGLPNCPLRYSLNEYEEGDAGKVHKEVLQRTASTPLLEERGWVVFRCTDVLPSAIPPLEDVREEVVKELLDRRARDEARTGLARIRKAAEDARSSLEEAAKAAGMETAVLEPFNEYSWRPPLPRDALADEAARAVAWKDPTSRQSAVMSRYYTYREVPVGAFSEVLDDVEGTGALYLVQVKTRVEPAFEEMTPAALEQERRAIGGQRIRDLGRELSYAGLKDRLSLFVDGEPAPDAEELGRRR